MRVLVTRAADKAATFCALLETAGLEPVCLPAIETQPVEDTGPLDAVLARLAKYRWIVFTSGTAAGLFGERAQALGTPLEGLGARVVAGPATAAVLAGYDLQVETVLAPFSAERALAALVPLVRPGDAVLLPRPEQGLRTLARGLQACGAHVDEVTLYRTAPAGAAGEQLRRQLAAGAIDAVTFFSPSAVQGLAAAIEAAGLPGGDAALHVHKERTPAACIGRTTAAAAAAAGWRMVIVPPDTTSASLVSALAAHLRREAVAC